MGPSRPYHQRESRFAKLKNKLEDEELKNPYAEKKKKTWKDKGKNAVGFAKDRAKKAWNFKGDGTTIEEPVINIIDIEGKPATTKNDDQRVFGTNSDDPSVFLVNTNSKGAGSGGDKNDDDRGIFDNNNKDEEHSNDKE